MTEYQRARLRPVTHERAAGAAGAGERSRGFLAQLLGPRGVGGVLDLAVDVLREHFGLLIGIGIAIWLPVRVVVFFQLKPALTDPFVAAMFDSAIAAVVAVLLGAFAARVMAAHLARGEVDPSDALGITFWELVGLSLLSLAVGVAVFLGVFMLLIGTFIARWLLALAPVVYVLETERGPLRRIGYSMARSVALVAGSFWRWLGLVTVFGLIVLLINVPVGYLDDPVERAKLAMTLGLSRTLVDLSVCFLGACFLALSAALSGVIFSAFYFDQRSRLEGVDLYLGLADLRAERSAGGLQRKSGGPP